MFTAAGVCSVLPAARDLPLRHENIRLIYQFKPNGHEGRVFAISLKLMSGLGSPCQARSLAAS